MILDVSTHGVAPAQARRKCPHETPPRRPVPITPGFRRRHSRLGCERHWRRNLIDQQTPPAPRSHPAARRHLIDDLNAAPYLKNGSCEDDETLPRYESRCCAGSVAAVYDCRIGRPPHTTQKMILLSMILPNLPGAHRGAAIRVRSARTTPCDSATARLRAQVYF
jgi:hypothetical protein